MAREPFRLAVKKSLCAVIKTVKPSAAGQPDNGVVNDLSDFDDDGIVRERVVRGRELFGTTDPLPMVSLLEDPVALEGNQAPGGEQQEVGEWVLLLTGFVEDDPENPTDRADVLAAEVIEVIAKAARERRNILGFGYQMPAVTKIRIGAPVVRGADGVNSDQAFFWLRIYLTLAEDRENPFA